MENILEIKNVSKQYQNHRALDHVSFNVPKGQIFGLLGPNGAGKTSLIRIINQITAPDSGSVLFDGSPLEERHTHEIGYLPEERGLYKKMKVGEQLLYLSRLKGLSKDEAMAKLKYWFEKFEIQPWWEKKIEDLSKGMQQKIQFVATVLHQPKLIILDEPFSGFDPINANLIKDEILELKNSGSSIIFSTHRMESVEELCDHIALINQSKLLLYGTKTELKEQFKSNTFEVVYSGSLNADNNFAQETSKEQLSNGLIKSNFKLEGVTSSSELIKSLASQVNIISFKENIPSVNDIFIKAVQQ